MFGRTGTERLSRMLKGEVIPKEPTTIETAALVPSNETNNNNDNHDDDKDHQINHKDHQNHPFDHEESHHADVLLGSL